MPDSDMLSKIDHIVREAKKHLQKEDAYLRLKANKDFQLLITDGYLRDVALNLIKVRGSNECVGDVAINNEKDLTSIGRLHRYFEAVHTNARIAESEIESAHELTIQLDDELEGN